MSMKNNVTTKLEKAFPAYAIALHRYTKSNIFASPDYKVPKIKKRDIINQQKEIEISLNNERQSTT